MGGRKRRGRERDTVSPLEDRLGGDLAALSDFARELSQLGAHPAGRPLLDASEGVGPSPGGRAAGYSERLNVQQDTVEHDLARLVLSLIELVRRLLEKQAMRRMESGTLSDDEIERLGETFLKLDARMDELKEAFGLGDDDLSLNLGPLGELM